jgi:hypothetical protein
VRLIAISFIGIALYGAYDAVMKLLGLGERPERSRIYASDHALDSRPSTT